MSNASHDLRSMGNAENFPGFNHPLQFSPMRPRHKPAMIKAVWSSHQQLRGFIGWARFSRSWNAKSINRFIDSHINDVLPNQHFVFTIGEEIVGVGSLVRSYSPLDSQISLWVVSEHHGKGIGKAIVQTLEQVAWLIWGNRALFYEHDSQNEASKKLPQRCGFELSHTRNIEKSAEQESGFWFCWKKERPEGLPDAIIQGRPIEDYTTP